MNNTVFQEAAVRQPTLSEQTVQRDPIVPRWAATELPDTWVDKINFKKPSDVLRFFKLIIRPAKRKIKLPENLPGKDFIPKYVLQEFHNLPNGNYSNRITRGYIRGFDLTMAGKMKSVRPYIAEWFSGLESALDVGTAGGRMANALKLVGVKDVWGLDPSPYLLKHAATSYPNIKFVQGLAEKTGFPDSRFAGVSACFLLHEIPPNYAKLALKEFNRILKPNGILAICEPSAVQYKGSWTSLFLKYGLMGLYFKCLVKSVYEPFIKAWHNQDMVKILEAHGFKVIKNEKSMPTHCILARKT